MTDSVGVIICAAGKSSRFGGKKRKPFVDVAGRPAFMHSVELFSNIDDVKQILIAVSPEDQEFVEIHWGANLKFFGVKICPGGEERFDTVNNALKLIKDENGLVAIHDAARCCLKKEWVDEVIKTASKTGAAILASPVVATLKEVRDKSIVKTVDRTGLFEAQTPQVFSTELIKKAYGNLKNCDKNKISDDSLLIEAIGHKVSIVETDSSNIKITHQSDVAIAEAIIKSRPKPKPKGPTGPYIEAEW